MVTNPCSVYSIVHSPILEQYIRHTSSGAALAQTSNSQSMTREAAISVLRNDIATTIRNSDTIIAVITIVAIEGDVGAANVDAIGVGGRRHGLGTGVTVRSCVDKMVADLNVGPRNAKAPSDGLDYFDVGDLAIGHMERRDSRSVRL